MTNYEAAQEWLGTQQLTWRLSRVPRKCRDSMVEAFVLNRPRYSGMALQRKVREHIEEAGVVPLWLIGPLLDIVVRLMVILLERWWSRNDEN